MVISWYASPLATMCYTGECLQATTVLLQLAISERRWQHGLQQSSSMACIGETVSWSRWAIHTQITTNVNDGIKTIVQGNLADQRYFEQILRPVVVPFAQVPGFVCLFCCFTSQVNSCGHCGTVSSPNHTFSLASLNKQVTSTSCTYFRL